MAGTLEERTQENQVNGARLYRPVPHKCTTQTVGQFLWKPMPDFELQLYKSSFAETALFYWVNSRMRYWLDYTYFVEPEWQRAGDARPDLPAFYKDFKPVRDRATSGENLDALWDYGATNEEALSCVESRAISNP